MSGGFTSRRWILSRGRTCARHAPIPPALMQVEPLPGTDRSRTMIRPILAASAAVLALAACNNRGNAPTAENDRKTSVQATRVSVHVDLGARRTLKKQNPP